MTVKLTKGQAVDLGKSNPTLKHVDVGLGWDPVDKETVQEKKGLLGGILKAANSIAKADIDIDASAFLLNANGKFEKMVYYGQLSDAINGVRLSGDDLTGSSASSGNDNEVIFIDLETVTHKIQSIAIWANIYSCESRGQSFKGIKNAFVRLVDRATREEICKYDLSNGQYDSYTAVHMGTLVREGSGWKFIADGLGTHDTGLSSIKQRYC